MEQLDPVSLSQRSTSTNSNSSQSAPSMKTDGMITSSDARGHQSESRVNHVSSAQPYIPITRPWASGYPPGPVVHASDDQNMTPMDRWISQDISTEAWTNVQGVYGTYLPQADVDVVDDGTGWSDHAVCGSQRGKST
jgi:hypothetical protein